VAAQRSDCGQFASLCPACDRLRVYTEHGCHLSRCEEGFSFGRSRYHGAPLWCLRSELFALTTSVPPGLVVGKMKCPDSRKRQEIGRCSLDQCRSTLDLTSEIVHTPQARQIRRGHYRDPTGVRCVRPVRRSRASRRLSGRP
jgi:hypothetical protein